MKFTFDSTRYEAHGGYPFYTIEGGHIYCISAKTVAAAMALLTFSEDELALCKRVATESERYDLTIHMNHRAEITSLMMSHGIWFDRIIVRDDIGNPYEAVFHKGHPNECLPVLLCVVKGSIKLKDADYAYARELLGK